ncbi:DUF2267 domain-containing protein [Thioclava sp. F36-6]|uniref:DUF2267 domain-containing protein n=1 Tax=Thioclava sp. F36-6 TaxID=1915316 RepID=UPI00099641BC|nr:DUF2267 domain-containing protein [Thioclava sp. F36-6]OOY30841.1 hypothetical protein BMI88_17075 [Thioclava sp. F36-6]
MKVTGLSAIDHAPQIVAEWLNDLEYRLDNKDRSHAYLLLRTTLHAIRDFLTTAEAADLGAQLPVLLRGIYYDGFVPSRQPAHPRNRDAFVGRVAEAFADRPLDDPEAEVAAVFDLLHERISEGEYRQVTQAMRHSLRSLIA